MEHILKNNEGEKTELSVILTKEDLAPHYEKAYAEASKNIKMEGFRKGKVPMQMIKRIYGKSIEADAIKDIINEVFAEVIKENDIRFTGEPELLDVLPTEGEGLEFKILIDYTPQIELKDYSGIKIEEPVYVVADEDIQKEIDRICREFGEFEEATSVAQDCVVSVAKKLLNAETHEPIISEKSEDEETIDLTTNIYPNLKNSLIGRTKGESFEILLPHPQNPEEQILFSMTVNHIDSPVPAEFTDAIVTEVTKGQYNTTEEYREMIGFEMQKYYDQKSREATEGNLIREICSLHSDYDVPESAMVEGAKNIAINMMTEMMKMEVKPEQITDDMIEYYKPIAKESFIWNLIVEAVAKKEDIKVEEYDYEQFIETNYSTMKEEQKKMLINMIADSKKADPSILHKKVVEFLLDFVEKTEVDFLTGKPLEDNDTENTENTSDNSLV